MKNILARGGVEFLAVFLGIALSLWVDEYQKTKESKKLSNQILNRLYKNLEADSTDGLWNQKAHNLVIKNNDPLAHAEYIAIKKAVKKLKGTTTRVIIKRNGIKIISAALELFRDET